MNGPAFLPDPDAELSLDQHLDRLLAELDNVKLWRLNGIDSPPCDSLAMRSQVIGKAYKSGAIVCSEEGVLPRTYPGLARERHTHLGPWWLWALMAVPVVVALVWRLA